jgi:hypothetical protein
MELTKSLHPIWQIETPNNAKYSELATATAWTTKPVYGVAGNRRTGLEVDLQKISRGSSLCLETVFVLPQ